MANHLTNLAQTDEKIGNADEAAKTRRELEELKAGDPAETNVDARLSSVIAGKENPKDDSERIQLAYRAYEKSLHAAAAKLFADAFASDPKLSDDRQALHRYNAACAASLAASGKGKDDPQPNDLDKTKLRKQSLEWLKAELDIWTKILGSGSAEEKSAISKTLEHWKNDADLADIRDEKELAKLPEAEREAFKKLWDEHGKLVAKAMTR